MYNILLFQTYQMLYKEYIIIMYMCFECHIFLISVQIRI